MEEEIIEEGYAEEDLRRIAYEIDALKKRPQCMEAGYDVIMYMLGLCSIFEELKVCYKMSFTPEAWTDNWDELLHDCYGRLYAIIPLERDFGGEFYNTYYCTNWLERWHDNDVQLPDSLKEMKSQLKQIAAFISSIDTDDWRYHIDLLKEEMCEYIDNMRLGRDFTPDEENSLRESLVEIETEEIKKVEGDFDFRLRKSNLLKDGKTTLDILNEMQDEARVKASEKKDLGEIFYKNYSRDDLFPIFRRLYMRSDWKPFLEACIKFRWCDEKIAELNKEEEKASLESHEPGPVHETEEEMETMVQGSNDDVPEETIAAVMACFRQNGNENINKREEALKFIRQVKERTPKEVGVLIGELVEKKLLSDVECHKKLWKPLHDAGFYEEGVKNWNKHIKNNL